MKKLLTTLAIAASLTAQAEVRDTYVSPQPIYNIDDALYVHTWTPIYNQDHLIVRHMGLDQANITPTWDVSQYTCVSPSGSLQNTTRGAKDGTTTDGPNAYQIDGTEYGVMLNSWSFPDIPVVGGGPHAIWNHLWKPWTDEAPRPWSLSHWGDLTIQASVKIPHAAYWGKSVAQVSFVVYGQDTSNPSDPKLFALVINLYDNREIDASLDAIGNDGQPFLSTTINSSQLSTKNFWSASHQNDSFDNYQFFRAHIKRSNLLNGIAMLNVDGRNMSTNPDDYQITSVHLLIEGFRLGGQFSIGVGFKDVMVLSCNNGEC